MAARRAVPITGSRAQMRTVAPVLTNAADTSRDAQRIVRRPPMPFENPYGPANVRAGRSNQATLGIPYGQAKPVNAKNQSYGKHVGIAAAARTSADMMAAVGYGPSATMSTEPIISGRTLQNRANHTGPTSQPVASGGEWQTFKNTRRGVPAADVNGVARGTRDYHDPTGNKYLNGPMHSDGAGKGSRFRGASLTQRPARKKGEAAFYGQR